MIFAKKITVIFNSLYLPPLEFFVHACSAEMIMIEASENFRKQTYRNRCSIYSANGPIDLSIYLEKCRRNHLPIKEMRLSYAQAWNKIHWRAIVSAYNNSPFFMYYSHDFEKFYNKEYTWLLDYNTQLLSLCFKLMRMEKDIAYTQEYLVEYPEGIDQRNKFLSAQACKISFQKYPQVFAYKEGFIPNLSIIDLLFNRGPEAEEYLMQHAEAK
ncbi:MAG: WbqC family protein [Bacteroidota bacterium]